MAAENNNGSCLMNGLIILVGLIFVAIKYRAATIMINEGKKHEETHQHIEGVDKEV